MGDAAGTEQISIHAPREGCDVSFTIPCPTSNVISIHAPREGCDTGGRIRHGFAGTFQSTHPVRGATSSQARPMPPRGISIHAPREGCDPTVRPCGCVIEISIHAPREGCDFSKRSLLSSTSYFNPRTP